MSDTSTPAREKNARRFKFRVIVAALISMGLAAIAFTLVIIQIQTGATGYLAGLSVWSRGQVETIRHSNIYARTGNPDELAQARYWHQFPLGDLEARLHLEADPVSYEGARLGFLKGGNHPDDIPRMIWLFRAMENAPYFRDAIAAWRDSDIWILQLGTMINRLETAWQQQTNPAEALSVLQHQLDHINLQLGLQAMEFRKKMGMASRALATILSVATIVFLTLLGSLATILILKLTRSIRSSEHKFRKTFEQAAIGITQLDEHGQILEANKTLCDILKYPRENLIGRKYQDLIFPEDRQIDIESRNAVTSGERDSLSVKQRLCQRNGNLVWAKTTLSGFDSNSANEARYICIVEDVSEQHRLSEELSYQARHDTLTGLINRRAFEGYLEDALLKARSENFVHGLCFIDLDQFKVINDTLGHHAGDQLLQQVTQVLARTLRKSDLLARIGGDEFGLILDCCQPEEALNVAESMRTALNETPFVWQGKSFNIGCSIGIVPIMADSTDEAELLQAADSACHLAKEQGRNRVLLTYQDDEALAARKTQMEWLERIRFAIDNDKLILYAQHISPLKSELGQRIEVLIRMQGDTGEIIPPGAFLPAAERFGLAHMLDRWVIEAVCAYFNDNPNELALIEACHINISGTSFDHSDFTDFALNTLKACHIPADKLCFEITETAAIANLTHVQNFMESMRRAGCTFALDDFGAGLSSFAYLKQLPVEYLKIDGTFVRNMASDEADHAMVRAISNIGQTLGKIMVAEFVENQTTLESLKEIGVQFAQGYHLHRPENLDQVIKQFNGKTQAG